MRCCFCAAFAFFPLKGVFYESMQANRGAGAVCDFERIFADRLRGKCPGACSGTHGNAHPKPFYSPFKRCKRSLFARKMKNNEKLLDARRLIRRLVDAFESIILQRITINRNEVIQRLKKARPLSPTIFPASRSRRQNVASSRRNDFVPRGVAD